MNTFQRTSPMLSFGTMRPACAFILLLCICFAHWVTMTTPHQMQHLSLRKGTYRLSLAQWYASERWPPCGQPTWRRWSATTREHGEVPPSRHSSPDSHSDPPGSHHLGHWTMLHLGDSLVEQPSQSRGFANIERCNFLTALVRVAPLLFSFNLLCNRIFEPS